MSTASRFASMTLAAASLFGAAAAHADTIVLTPIAPGVSFGLFAHAVDGLFIDDYDFSPPTFSGLVSVDLKGVSGNVGFFTATLNGMNFSFFPESGATDFAFQANVTADVPLALTVFGSTLDADGNVGGAGVYSGTVTAGVPLAVPEAQTWALLLAGLGVTGLAASRGRRRRPVGRRANAA